MQGGRLVQVRGRVLSPRAGRWAVTQQICSSALQPRSRAFSASCAPGCLLSRRVSLNSVDALPAGCSGPGRKRARQHAAPGDLPSFLTHSLQAGAFQAGLTLPGRLPESSAALSTSAGLPPAA